LNEDLFWSNLLEVGPECPTSSRSQVPFSPTIVIMKSTLSYHVVGRCLSVNGRRSLWLCSVSSAGDSRRASPDDCFIEKLVVTIAIAFSILCASTSVSQPPYTPSHFSRADQAAAYITHRNLNFMTQCWLFGTDGIDGIQAMHLMKRVDGGRYRYGI